MSVEGIVEVGGMLVNKRILLEIGMAIAVSLVAGVTGRAGALPAGGGSHWAAVYVEGARARVGPAGLLSGEEFNRPIGRGMFVHLLVGLLRPGGTVSVGGPGASCFRDVPWDHWAAPAITAAYERGWVQGDGEGRFLPESAITRGESVVILVRALRPRSGGRSADGSALDGFEESVPDWAKYEVEEAIRLGWLKGDPGGRLRLGDGVTLGEACALVWRAGGLWGGMYDVAGSVLKVEPGMRRLTVSSASGVVDLEVADSASVFRNGRACGLGDIGPLDEASVICDGDGVAVFIDARFVDDVGIVESVDSGTGELRYVDRSGLPQTVNLSRGVEVRVQGNKSSPESVVKGDRVYLLFDTATGQIRFVDAFRDNVGGRVVSVSGDLSALRARVAGSGDETLRLTDGTVVYLNSEVSDPSVIRPGDVFQGGALPDGRLLFIQIMRSEAR